MTPQKHTKHTIMLIISAAAVLLTVIGMIILPDTLVVQLNTAGEAGNTMPKLLGLLLPFALSTVFAVLYYRNEDKERQNITISVIGVVILVLTFLFNL